MEDAIGVVAGSGIALEGLLDRTVWERPFSAFGGLDAGEVAGHSYTFALGECAGHRVIVQRGRLHAYEGHSLEQATRAVDVLHALGAGVIVFTNAAGGLTPDTRTGDVVAAKQVRTWPYPRYGLPEELRPELVTPGCTHTGCYAWMHGPCYETRAEIAMLRAMGCLAVGMSAAPELFRCRELGIRAGLVSCITNACVTPMKLTHEHVLEAARRASDKLCAVLRGFVAGS